MFLTILYITLAFIGGLAISWIIAFNKLRKERKELKSTSGYLEGERLVKETLQKELAVVHRNKMAAELDLSQKLQAAEKIIQQMDSDIILMQKNFEETEALLEAKHPELHLLKVELIEAKNTICRLKAAISEKDKGQ